MSGWLEAFAAHPQIGDTASLRSSRGAFAESSRGEQAAALATADGAALRVQPHLCACWPNCRPCASVLRGAWIAGFGRQERRLPQKVWAHLHCVRSGKVGAAGARQHADTVRNTRVPSVLRLDLQLDLQLMRLCSCPGIIIRRMRSCSSRPMSK